MQKKVFNILLVYQVKQFLKVCSTFLGPPILFVYTIIFFWAITIEKPELYHSKFVICNSCKRTSSGSEFSAKYIVENHISSNREKISP